jgi:hypothetical protein
MLATEYNFSLTEEDKLNNSARGSSIGRRAYRLRKELAEYFIEIEESNLSKNE